MKYKLILLVIAAMIPCSQLAAQELLDIDTYDQKTIYIYHGIMGDGFVKNGEIMRLGTFSSNLAREVAGSKYALKEMQKSRKYKIVGTVTSLVATGIGLTGTIMALRGDNDDRTFEITSIVVGIVCGIVAEGFNRSALGAMNRAVWLYNRDVMAGWLRN